MFRNWMSCMIKTLEYSDIRMILLKWNWRSAFIRTQQPHLSRKGDSNDRLVRSIPEAQDSTSRCS